MGVIKRQSIKRSVVSYVGALLGFASTIFIYPLDLEVYGFIQWMIGVANFLFPFASLGGTVLAIRFFRDFKKGDSTNGFFAFLLLWLFLAIGLFGTLGFIFRVPLFDFLKWLNFKPYFEEHSLSAFFLCILIILVQLLLKYTSNFNRIVIPDAVFNLGIKIGIPTLILLHIAFGLSFEVIKWLLLILYLAIVLTLLIYLYTLKGLDFNLNFEFLNRAGLKEMFNYAAYGIFGSIGAVFAFSIDIIMVAPLTDFGAGGLYNIALFIGNTIAIPLAAVIGIASPIISSSFGKEDIEEVENIYYRSSKILFTLGLLLLTLVWLSLDDLFHLTQKYDELIVGSHVVLVIGIARVIDMTTGVNGSIIGYSKYYRFNLLAMLVLSFSNVFITYALIPQLGILGAAIGTAISIVLYNLIKFVFIWVKFKMQPIDLTYLAIFGIAVFAYLISSLIPSTGESSINYIINIGLNSSVALLLFVIPLLYFRLVPDINETAAQAWQMIRSRLG